MDEYINRTIMLATLNRAVKDGVLFSDWSTDAVIAFIERQPLANVAPVRHGKWILKRWNDVDGEFWQCNQCGYRLRNEDGTYKKNYYPYCPNCGRKNEIV